MIKFILSSENEILGKLVSATVNLPVYQNLKDVWDKTGCDINKCDFLLLRGSASMACGSFLGQRLNSSHSSNPSCYSDNIRSLTHCTRELPLNGRMKCSTFRRVVLLRESIFPKWQMLDAGIKDPFRVEDRPVAFNVLKYKNFNDMISDSILQRIFFFFWQPHLWHMEVPRVMVKFKLQLPATSVTYNTGHGNVRSSTYWASLGIEPTSSWIPAGLISTGPQREFLNNF